MDDIKNLTVEALAALIAEKREALAPLFAAETPTDEQIAEANTLAADLEALEAEDATRKSATDEAAAKFAAAKEKFTVTDPEPEGDENDDENDDEAKTEPEQPAAEETPAAEAPAAATIDEDALVAAVVKAVTAGQEAAAPSTREALAARTTRPAAPGNTGGNISITAAADVPDFAAGKSLDGIGDVATALVNRTKGFPKFSPNRSASKDGKPQLHKFGVASFSLDFPAELTIDRGSDDMEVLYRAADESRLDGDSLVAAGGWCAPSETLYDLCDGETLDGIVSVPEVNVARGGINYTSGPDFSTFYGEGFLQTEAQAIAGDTKDCYEIVCPDFDEVRLDAIGLCITVPILTNSAYPELTRRVVSGSLVAHQHRVNFQVLTRMAAASTARDFSTGGLGATATDTLEALELVANQRRQHYRLGINSTLEVVLPFWVRGALRSDISRRSAIADETIQDALLEAEFSARNLNVQWAYDWQPLDENAEVYPATYNALIYPAGTFVKGTSDVINLSAVYDAASLQVNTYTGVFMEQGLLVAKMCYGSDLATLPICNAGVSGANEFTCTVTP